MPLIDPSVQGTEGWFKARCGRATASRFSDVLATLKSKGEAASRRNYRSQLVVERLTGEIAETYQSQAMKQGIEREPIARLEYMARTGSVVEEVGFMQHDVLLAGASLDGIIGVDGTLEIKCPEPSAHIESLRSKSCPPEYVAQIQGGLWISGRQYCDFVSWHPSFPERMRIVIRRIPRLEEYIAQLAVEVETFLAEVNRDVKELESL